MAAAIAAAKLHIPICHVEAGIRTHSKTNPEEINRICTDHVSNLLLASTKSGYDEMASEGLQNRALLVGEPMYDAFIEYSNKLNMSDIRLFLLQGGMSRVPEEYYYLTCHREENTNDDKELLEIFKATEILDAPTIYPVHPRNKQRAMRIVMENHFSNVILTEPVGYLESTCLVKNAKKYTLSCESEMIHARKRFDVNLNLTELRAGDWRAVLCSSLWRRLLQKNYTIAGHRSIL